MKCPQLKTTEMVGVNMDANDAYVAAEKAANIFEISETKNPYDITLDYLRKNAEPGKYYDLWGLKMMPLPDGRWRICADHSFLDEDVNVNDEELSVAITGFSIMKIDGEPKKGDVKDKSINLPGLKLPYKAVNEVWSIYGKRGYGKSYLLDNLFEELCRLDVPFIIVDPHDAHKSLYIDNLVHLHISNVDSRNLIERLGNDESIVLSGKGCSMDELRNFVAEFCTDLNKVGFGPKYGKPVVVAIEECHIYCAQGHTSEIRSSCLSSIDRLIRDGRSKGVGMVLVGQEVLNIITNIRRHAGIQITFNLDKTDIKALGKTVDDKFLKCVPELKVGEFACFSPLFIDGSGIVVVKDEPDWKKEMDDWIEEHGSEHLKKVKELGYRYHRGYRTERLESEISDLFDDITYSIDSGSFWWDLKDDAEYKDRDTPTERALEVYLDLTEKYKDMQVVWLVKHPVEFYNSTVIDSIKRNGLEAIVFKPSWSNHDVYYINSNYLTMR